MISLCHSAWKYKPCIQLSCDYNHLRALEKKTIWKKEKSVFFIVMRQSLCRDCTFNKTLKKLWRFSVVKILCGLMGLSNNSGTIGYCSLNCLAHFYHDPLLFHLFSSRIPFPSSDWWSHHSVLSSEHFLLLYLTVSKMQHGFFLAQITWWVKIEIWQIDTISH